MKFLYKNENGEVHIEAAGYDMQQLAAECGVMIQHLYSALAHQEPMAAKQFQVAVMISLMPSSPVWQAVELSEGGSMTMVLGKQ